MTQMRRFNLGPVGEADCPVFDGMFEYCAVRGLLTGLNGAFPLPRAAAILCFIGWRVNGLFCNLISDP